MFHPVTLSHYLIVGAVLFTCGVLSMVLKRNALGVLMGVELALNGANINWVALSNSALRSDPAWSLGLDGQLTALFVIVLAAGEAAVALAIALNYYRLYLSVDVDQANQLKG